MKLKRVSGRMIGLALTSCILVSTVTASSASKGYSYSSASVTNGPGRASNDQLRTPRRRVRTYDVLHYIIRTSFDVPNKTVIGEVDVILNPLSNGFKFFDLDAANMQIESVSLSSGPPINWVVRPDTLHIVLDRAYDSTDNITLKIKYRARPSRGLYFISSRRDNGFLRPAHVWTQGEPEDNHYWFPCYDFPDDKSTSEQYITTTGDELAIANGTLVDVASDSSGSRTFHWHMGQPHSSYLISLIVGNYARIADSYKDVQLEYFTYPGTEKQARRAFETTPLMIDWFSRVLKFDFPYDRYAQTVVGDFIFGGMENITSTTFADTEILTPDSDEPGSTVDLVSHELAHSWFGDLVTCKDWAHLWLNEGFATFMEASFREHQSGRGAYLSELQTDAKDYFLDDPSREHHPLVNPNYPLTMRLFDATTYKKGAYVVHMLRETVGDAMFWKALNTYLNEYKYRTVDSRDLQRVFEKVSGQSLEWFFGQWVYKAGYPELRVRTNYSPAKRQLTLTVTQTQKAVDMTPAVFRLPIEIEIVTASGARTERVEVNRRTQDFRFQLDSKPRWIIFDKRASVLKKLSIIQSRAMAAFVIVDGADSPRLGKDTGLFDERYMEVPNSMPQWIKSNLLDELPGWPFSSSLFTRFGGNEKPPLSSSSIPLRHR